VLQGQMDNDGDLTADDDDDADGDDYIDLALDVTDETQPLHPDYLWYILILHEKDRHRGHDEKGLLCAL